MRKLTLNAIQDGSASTLALVEATDPIIWTKPGDIPFGQKEKFPTLGGQIEGEFYALFFDGHVERLRDDIDAKDLKALVTTSSGESVDVKKLRARDKE